MPHYVTSNVLGARNFPQNPANSPDYDSLLEIVNGDFGVKSAVVKAATEEPIYEGSETNILPLYIPKGAIPIKLARIARSGVGVSSLRIPLRRPRVQSTITSRRQGGPRRPNPPAPTPPSSFLRGWGRRISPKAESRLGLQLDDSKASSSRQTSHTLKIPDAKRIDSNLTDTPRSTLNSKSTDTKVNNSTTTEKPLVKVSTPESDFSVAVSSKLVKDNLSRNQTVSSTTENTIDKVTQSNQRVASAERDAFNRKESLQLQSKSDISKKPTKSSRGNGRFPFPRPPAGRNTSLRNSRISTTESSISDKKSSLEDDNDSKSSIPNRPPSLKRIRQTLMSRNNDANSNKKETTTARSRINEPSTQRNVVSQLRIQFPTRPTTPKTKDPDIIDHVENIESNITLRNTEKFRLPLSSLKISKDSREQPMIEHPSESNSRSTSNSFQEDDQVSSPPSVPIPVRRRRPLRTRLPPPDSIISPVVNLPSLSITPAPSTQAITQPSEVRKSSTELPVSSSTTSSTTSKVTFTTTTSTTTTTERPTPPKSPSSTTTSTIRRIHEFFKIPSNVEVTERTRTLQTTKHPRNTLTTKRSRTPERKPYSSTSTTKPFTITTTTKPFTITTTTTTSTTTPQSVSIPTTRYWRKTSNRKGGLPVHPPRRAPGSQPVPPSSKSAAEIVLSSLSEVMRDVTTDDMDKLKKIAADLDALNKKLSERGILIIHAEVDGVILNLRNQTVVKTRNAALPYRGTTGLRENGSLHESEKESLQPQSLSVRDDTSTTIYTPSDKLAYDVLSSSGELKESKDRVLYDIAPETINEVSTTLINKITNLTTIKPSMKAEKPAISTTTIESSELVTEEYIREEIIKSTTANVIEASEIQNNVISATPTQPSATTTRSRTSVIPVLDNNSKGFKSIVEDFVSAEDSTENEADSAEHPDSYEGATKSKIHPADQPTHNHSPTNSTHINIILKSKADDRSEEESLIIDEYFEEAVEADFVDEKPANATTDSSGSSVYLVGIVGIFPLAGVAAYVVRKYLRGDSHKKALPDSEERPDGYTPPTHHHIRTHSLLPVSSIPSIKV